MADTKPAKMTASKVATEVPKLLQRIEALEKQAQTNHDRLSKQEAWIHLALTCILSLLRWAYAWVKSQKLSKRMETFKQQGEAVNAALEQIEPEF